MWKIECHKIRIHFVVRAHKSAAEHSLSEYYCGLSLPWYDTCRPKLKGKRKKTKQTRVGESYFSSHVNKQVIFIHGGTSRHVNKVHWNAIHIIWCQPPYIPSYQLNIKVIGKKGIQLDWIGPCFLMWVSTSVEHFSHPKWIALIGFHRHHTEGDFVEVTDHFTSSSNHLL